MTYFPGSSVFPETHGPQSVCFPSLAPATFPGNTIDTIRSLLWSSYKSSSYKWLSQGVARFENNFNIVSVRYTCELSRDTSYGDTLPHTVVGVCGEFQRTGRFLQRGI